MQQHRQNRPTHKRSRNQVAFIRPKPREVAHGPTPISIEVVLVVLIPRHRSVDRRIRRVNRVLPRQPELLPRAQRCRVPVVGHIEVRHKPHQPLLLFHLDLFFRLLMHRHRIHFRRYPSYRQRNRTYLVALPRIQYPLLRPIRQTLGNHRHHKLPRRHSLKMKAPILTRGHLTLHRDRIRQCHHRPTHRRPIRIRHRSMNASQPSLRHRLLQRKLNPRIIRQLSHRLLRTSRATKADEYHKQNREPGTL